MLFNTTEFLIFFIMTLVVYWILPGKVRYIWLLAASYYFYMQWNPWYIILLISVTLITYAGGLLIQKISSDMSRKRVLVLTVCLVICLGVLGVFKYINFAIQMVDHVLAVIGVRQIPWFSDWILPVGISFYTLQALGYLIDVYRGDIYAEKNIIRFALFVSFFPQLVAGPIERSKNLLTQLGTVKKFSLDKLRRGLMLMLYGLFLKMVIADRAAIFVDEVYNNAASYTNVYIIVATLLFTIQIYCDFYGYSTIARGAALTMGYTLMENFNAPYFSKSIQEFWRRWHISLSTWFRDYLYIPLGGNRKGKVRKNINLMIVFAVSGLWHGASLAFVFWGILHGLYQVAANILGGVGLREKFRSLLEIKDRLSDRCLKVAVTFTLVSFAWLFFRAGSLGYAGEIIQHILYGRDPSVLFNGDLFTIGIDRNYFSVLLLSVLGLAFVDHRKYKGHNVLEEFFAQGIWFRVPVVVGLIFVVLLFGVYGELYDAASFIYFQF